MSEEVEGGDAGVAGVFFLEGNDVGVVNRITEHADEEPVDRLVFLIYLEGDLMLLMYFHDIVGSSKSGDVRGEAGVGGSCHGCGEIVLYTMGLIVRDSRPYWLQQRLNGTATAFKFISF